MWLRSRTPARSSSAPPSGSWGGKPLGIFAGAYLAVRLGVARAPETFGWTALLGAAALCGVGFTMAMLVATAAFDGSAFLAEAKLSVLSGSLVAGLLGWIVLSRALGRERSTADIGDGA